MPTAIDPKRINASPTKAFFIHMITRDVPLTRAILDLVDNCVDGARKERDGNDYSGLWIRLELTSQIFRIADNCGGISVHIAREYAFRFGRPDDAEETAGSIGQFGVGMKRSFFKLGREFIVRSIAAESRFVLKVDVDKWMMQPEEEATAGWHFEFDEVEENIAPSPNEQCGTIIEITRLCQAIGESFALENFRARLADEISAAHSLSMDRGLTITLNGLPIIFAPHKLLHSDELQPSFLEKTIPRKLIDGQPEPPVRVKLYAGLADRSLHDGGWYIFCNGRLVLRADQTSATVWGSSHNLPQYHPNYAYFRGFAYFDSDHAALLPWTTTKTGVDIDSRVYRVIQKEMVEMTRPVTDFLNKLERERREREVGDRDDEPLKKAMESARETRAETITDHRIFKAPILPPRPPGPVYQKIQYTKPVDAIAKVKQLLGVTTFTAVGEKTFEYFLKNEGED